jgi:aspartate kinase
MRSHPGVEAKMFDTLAGAGVNIQMISTSEIKISVVVDGAKGKEAMRLIHKAFLENQG